MTPARLVATWLLSCLILAPAVAASEQSRATNDDSRGKKSQRQARFRGMDANGDGVITRREWRGNARAFARHDINRDGVLSGTEVWTTEENNWQERGERDNPLSIAFLRTDDNRDGIISRQEWDSDPATFARVDVNGDGVITEREFRGEGWRPWTEADIASPSGRDDRVTGTSGTSEVQRDSRAYQNGYDRGLSDGRQAGREDRELRNQWDLEGQRELEQADAGYTPAVGAREAYQAGYRAGFRVGYRQGFGARER